MKTNNYVESCHNQLKTNYLQRKKNRRLACLTFILVDDVHTYFMYNTTRMAANIGHMNSETRETGKKMISAEEINELSLEDMVQKVYIEEICYIVKSLKTEVVYDISTEQGMMTACNCINFQRNRRVCKSEAGSGTDEALTNISNVCKQALESRIHLTFENNNRLSQIYNETKTVVVSK